MATVRQFFHPDTDWVRVQNHLPHGVILAMASLCLPWTAMVGGLVLFIRYELNEDEHKRDGAWNDVLGTMISYFTVITLAMVYKLIAMVF